MCVGGARILRRSFEPDRAQFPVCDTQGSPGAENTCDYNPLFSSWASQSSGLGISNSTAEGQGLDTLTLPNNHWVLDPGTVILLLAPARIPVGPVPPRSPGPTTAVPAQTPSDILLRETCPKFQPQPSHSLLYTTGASRRLPPGTKKTLFPGAEPGAVRCGVRSALSVG